MSIDTFEPDIDAIASMDFMRRQDAALSALSEMDNIDRCGDFKLKLDLEVGLENWFNWMRILGFLMPFVGALVAFEMWHETRLTYELLFQFEFWLALVVVLVVGCLIVLISVVLRALTDYHYQLDFSRNTLYYHRKFSSIRSMEPKISFGELLCVSVDAKTVVKKNRGQIGYGIVIVSKGGQLIPLSDFTPNSSDLRNHQSRLLALAMGILHLPNPNGKKIVYNNGEIDFK